jgi:hypothetical protein
MWFFRIWFLGEGIGWPVRDEWVELADLIKPQPSWGKRKKKSPGLNALGFWSLNLNKSIHQY